MPVFVASRSVINYFEASWNSECIAEVGYSDKELSSFRFSRSGMYVLA